MLALNPAAPYTYVCKADRALAPELQTVWTLKPLSVAEQALVDDSFGKYVDGNMQVTTGSQHLTALRIGLQAVSNFNSDTGVALPLVKDSSGMVSEDFLSRIPKDARTELARVIIAGGTLTEIEAKN